MFSRLNILSCEEAIDLMYFSARSGQCRTQEERDNTSITKEEEKDPTESRWTFSLH